MEKYMQQLIDELNEKVRRLEQDKDRQRREINRLKRELSKMKKRADNSTTKGGVNNGNDE